MSEQFEQAQEHLEHAAHEHGGSTSHTRAAIIIGIMAAVLAITEFVAKDAQTDYLTNHIAASDTWAQYQAKSVRRTILTAQADLLESMPATSDPAVKKRIADARANAERMRSEPGADGMEQLAEKAHDQEHERDHAMHRNHMLEIASGGLQIAIVLASISVVINLPAFMLVSVLVGGASAIYALLGGFSLLH
jgi:alkylation response protein AidB-like acyl-CoA dehydrogenase